MFNTIKVNNADTDYTHSIFDISEYTGKTYDTLSDALADVPDGKQKGGMTVSFVSTSDNKYIQYRLMADEFTTDTTQWTIADEGVYVENPEFVYVKTDAEGKILWAIKTDGGIYYGAGCPQQVKDYIEEKLEELSLDEYEDIVTFLSNYLGGDATLKAIIDDIVNVIPEETDNTEWLQVIKDSEGKVLEGITKSGKKIINIDIKNPTINKISENVIISELKELPITLVNGHYDRDLNIIQGSSSVCALIENADDKGIYLMLIPDEFSSSFAGKVSSEPYNVLKSTSACFSLKGCDGNIGFNIHNFICDKILDVPETINLGAFEYGIFTGSGANVASSKWVRTTRISRSNVERFKITFDDTLYSIVINCCSDYFVDSRNFEKIQSGYEFTNIGGNMRFGIAYKNGDDADSTLLSNANNIVTVEKIAENETPLSISTLTQSQISHIKVYNITTRHPDSIVVAPSDATDMDKRNADIVVDGSNDSYILQALIGCYDNLNIQLLEGNYNINSYHHIARSDQWASLSTFDTDGNKYRVISINGIYENSVIKTFLKVDNSLLPLFNEGQENHIVLIPRMEPVKDVYIGGFTKTALEVKKIALIGLLYNKPVTAFDTIAASSARYDGVHIYGMNTIELLRFPTMPNDNCVGIRTGRGSNNGIENYVKHCEVWHTGRGFSICGEHYLIEDCLAHHCKWGFAFHDQFVGEGVEHPNIMIGCSIEGCYQFMLLTRQGAMNQQEYDALTFNKRITTLICIGLSTETSWSIPTDEGGGSTPTLGILEVIPGRYRGRIEGDAISVVGESCKGMTITSY